MFGQCASRRVTGVVSWLVASVATVVTTAMPAYGQGTVVGMDTPIQFISISAGSTTMTVGQSQGLMTQATLATDPVQTRMIGQSIWNISFTPALPVGSCGTGATSFNSQAFGVLSSGAVDVTWSPGTPNTIRMTGTLGPLPVTDGATVTASLQCVSGGPIGSVSATWTGTQFDGTFSFGGVTGEVAVVGVTWSSSNPSVVSVSPFGSVQALAPGDATITATFGNRCWQPHAGENPDCRGTTSASVALQVVPGGGGGDPGGGGGGECAIVRVVLAPGSAIFATVDTTISDPTTGEVFGNFPFPIGTNQEAPEGQFRLSFTAPEGFTVTPAQVDLNTECGETFEIALTFAEDVPPPTIDTLIEQAAGAGFGQASNLLQNARARLQAGNTTAACNQIAAYMNQVRAQSGKRLSAEAAPAMLATAAEVRRLLGCG